MAQRVEASANVAQHPPVAIPAAAKARLDAMRAEGAGIIGAACEDRPAMQTKIGLGKGKRRLTGEERDLETFRQMLEGLSS